MDGARRSARLALKPSRRTEEADTPDAKPAKKQRMRGSKQAPTGTNNKASPAASTEQQIINTSALAQDLEDQQAVLVTVAAAAKTNSTKAKKGTNTAAATAQGTPAEPPAEITQQEQQLRNSSKPPRSRQPSSKGASSKAAAATASGPTRAAEQRLWEKGFKAVAGVDEAGRGPLAGPVVAAAAILPPDVEFPGLNDSKQMSEEAREELFQLLTTHPDVVYAVAVVDHEMIDEINILQAAMLAMQQAVQGLSSSPDHLLIDGNRKPKGLADIPAQLLVKGDATSTCIAAASVIAKVTRDRLMLELDQQYPQYGFAKHKGYGVPAHKAAIHQHGPCEVHRRSFEPVKSMTGWAGYGQKAAAAAAAAAAVAAAAAAEPDVPAAEQQQKQRQKGKKRKSSSEAAADEVLAQDVAGGEEEDAAAVEVAAAQQTVPVSASKDMPLQKGAAKAVRGRGGAKRRRA